MASSLASCNYLCRKRPRHSRQAIFLYIDIKIHNK